MQFAGVCYRERTRRPNCPTRYFEATRLTSDRPGWPGIHVPEAPGAGMGIA